MHPLLSNMFCTNPPQEMRASEQIMAANYLIL